VRAVIRKNRQTGWWNWTVTGKAMRLGGERPTWSAALAAALTDLEWLACREDAWPAGLTALGWRLPAGLTDEIPDVRNVRAGRVIAKPG
jgi:hypothetical protein